MANYAVFDIGGTAGEGGGTGGGGGGRGEGGFFYPPRTGGKRSGWSIRRERTGWGR